jgi:hypothetical protein
VQRRTIEEEPEPEPEKEEAPLIFEKQSFSVKPPIIQIDVS